MATPTHGLTRTKRGWSKRVNGKPKWIVSEKIAPTAELADAYYQKHFAELWEAEPTEDMPDVSEPAALTVGEIADLFFDRKERKRDAGRLGAVSTTEYDQALDDFCEFISALGGTKLGDRRPAELKPADFGDFNNHLANRFGVHRRKKFIILIRSLFKWAARPPLHLPLIDYGDEFGVPDKSELRKDRKRVREADGLPMFEPKEVRSLIAKADPTMKAMVLLAVNAGLGNTDLAELPRTAIAGEWLEYVRGKTGADRLARLWPETSKALRAVIRKKPAAPEFDALMFLTSRGHPFIRTRMAEDGTATKKDQIGMQFARLVKACELRKRGFYCLRRTYRTIAAETGEERAIDLSMGHADSAEDMGALYTVAVLRKKLERVSDHVRTRLLIVPKKNAASPRASKRSRKAVAGGARKRKARGKSRA